MSPSGKRAKDYPILIRALLGEELVDKATSSAHTAGLVTGFGSGGAMDSSPQIVCFDCRPRTQTTKDASPEPKLHVVLASGIVVRG